MPDEEAFKRSPGVTQKRESNVPAIDLVIGEDADERHLKNKTIFVLSILRTRLRSLDQLPAHYFLFGCHSSVANWSLNNSEQRLKKIAVIGI